MEYQINKGVDAGVEFRGLRAQYLFIFVGGLIGIFLLFVAMYLAGMSIYSAVTVTVILCSALIWITFYLNAQYGAHGLMKRMA